MFWVLSGKGTGIPKGSGILKGSVFEYLKDLPISCEYLNSDAVDITDQSSRIATYMIVWLGLVYFLSIRVLVDFVWS
jgi:hypothetical protein